MSFPKTIAESALLDCGRHCSICHKFCGTKIELHHIVPTYENGEDTYENCIPLCFDCHAEVKAYNPKHPKGKMYTTSELKEHRDRWYAKVRESDGVTVNPNYIELDRQLFKEIQKILPSDKGSIVYLRFHDYRGSTPDGIHSDLVNFIRKCIQPEFEFMDIDLEGARIKLADSMEHFLNTFGLLTFSLDGRPDRNAVPKEYSYGSGVQKKVYRESTDKLNKLKTDVHEAYDELIRSGRRKLAC